MPVTPDEEAVLAHERLNAALVRHYAPRLRHWLRQLYEGATTLAEVLFLQASVRDPDEARARLVALLTPAPGALAGLAHELGDLYRDAYAGGLHHAHRHHATTSQVARELLGTLSVWDPWRPLEHPDALLVEGAGLALLLDGSGALARSLAGTLRERSGELLASALRDGQTAEQLRWRLRAASRAVAQAELVATTEAARAQSAAQLDSIRAAGVPHFAWLLDPDPCEGCRAMAAANPHSVGSQPPPLHPGCRCTIRPS